MTSNYGGYEISGLVLDVGADTVKVGYSGEDCPRHINKTSLFYDSESSTYKTGVLDSLAVDVSSELTNPFKDGEIDNMDVFEKVWQLNLDKLTDDYRRPLLLVHQAWSSSKERERLCEIAFEKFNLPAFYLAKSPVMSCFAAGKPSGLVVDIGSSCSSVVPVYDGYVLHKGIFKQSLGGTTLNQFMLQDLFTKFNYKPTPAYRIRSKGLVETGKLPNVKLHEPNNISPSYAEFLQLESYNEFKETTCQVFETSFDKESILARPGKPYEFSDGFNLQFGLERYLYPELFFQPNLYQIDSTTKELPSIANLTYKSLMHFEVDTRVQFSQNILLAGGSSLFQGFGERLTFELTTLTNGQRVRVAPTQPTLERIYQPWLGGSILSSMGTFHQLWVSNQEYTELGAANTVEKRFS